MFQTTQRNRSSSRVGRVRDDIVDQAVETVRLTGLEVRIRPDARDPGRVYDVYKRIAGRRTVDAFIDNGDPAGPSVVVTPHSETSKANARRIAMLMAGLGRY